MWPGRVQDVMTGLEHVFMLERFLPPLTPEPKPLSTHLPDYVGHLQPLRWLA